MPDVHHLRPLSTTVNDSGGLHVGCVRRGNRGLGHCKRTANASVQQRFQPALFLRIAAVFHQHFHVAGVRRRAIENFRRNERTPGELGNRRVLQIAQAGTMLAGQEQVPEAFSFCLRLERFHQWWLRPGLPRLRKPGVVVVLGRRDVGIHEFLHAVLQRA
jgi:hypothetical protein